MADANQVTIRLEQPRGEQMISVTLHGRIDADGTFHYTELGRSGKEMTIPNAFDLVVSLPKPVDYSEKTTQL